MGLTMELEHASTCLVSPSSPTPCEWIDFSKLDLMGFHYCYAGMIYFFKLTPEHGAFPDIVQRLRNSLAQALVPYYPLAGRIVVRTGEIPRLHCNGSGAIFTEAFMDVPMDELIQQKFKPMPILSGMSAAEALLGHTPETPAADVPPLIVQITRLKCGGLVLAANLHHAAADGKAAMYFLTAWSQLSCGQEIWPVPVTHDRSPLKHLGTLQNVATILPLQPISNFAEEAGKNYITKLFYFSGETIMRMKAQVSAQQSHVKFTDYDCMCATLWRCRARALRLRGPEPTAFGIAVEMREKTVPPLGEAYLGTAIAVVWSRADAQDLLEKPISHAASLINATKKLVRDANYYSADLDSAANLFPAEVDGIPTKHLFGLSSLQNFPVYSGDFKLGRPVFGSINGSPVPGFSNAIRLPGVGYDVPGMFSFCTRSCNPGIKDTVLMICMRSEAMAKLEADPEFCYEPWPPADDDQ